MPDFSIPSYLTQCAYSIRFGWGPNEAAALSESGGCLVVVDVLSFTTAVSVVADAGGAVYPYRWRDESAAEHARAHGAALAVGRRAATPENPWSLSPAALRAAPDVERLVLPSPNGSAISAAARAVGGPVVAACLRNAGAVAAWLAAQGFGVPGRPVSVIASGEGWPDGGLRPCLEDMLGAGAVLSGLPDNGSWSPEAAAVRGAYRAVADVAGAVRACGGGVELVDGGFGGDVDVAVEIGSSRSVPVLRRHAFVNEGEN